LQESHKSLASSIWQIQLTVAASQIKHKIFVPWYIIEEYRIKEFEDRLQEFQQALDDKRIKRLIQLRTIDK
jgi:hypothetical protein